ncbi:Glycosyltransferase involved in cell wall bisynthesis [Mucilaginibacter gossypiicola]|uniref:Glycosyltransferase involved in cell wall bisynthesis n=1 Tax=Mucilaginibacter gossypiicola TaxID=551995 RepID=A0A1H8N1T7_9SPHI|nr:glycosyltransferase family 2 protein [Mucilaginibacter gossypiicola]SEO23601.1 Glycosyltransferase involved in cell wall bisynthesis [Mucilaginibacter gossypiicola]
MNPFFSIIIPLYNCESTLQQALNSITSQGFKNYELILVDGGSNDNTQFIISNFKKAGNHHIQFISEPDRGIYDAMNKGIDMATGQCLYFMGGDDILNSPAILDQIYNAIQNEPVDLIYGNVTGTVSNTKYADDNINKVLSRGIHHQGIFYKREVFNDTGKYNLKFRVAADYHLTLKVFCNPAFKTKYIDLDIARFGEAGLSSSVYDYRFYSYHYKFLSINKALNKIEDRTTLLQQSIYCSLWLVKEKQSMTFAWANILYYITGTNGLGISFRLKTFLRMVYWSLKPKP